MIGIAPLPMVKNTDYNNHTGIIDPSQLTVDKPILQHP